MINKSRKAVIRAAANKARKDGVRAIYDLGEGVENPMSILMEYKQKALKSVCQSEEEESYFELCYVHRSEKGAKEFELWNQGFWASFPESKAENRHEA